MTGTVRVIFSRSHRVGSALLRVAMWSQWSHCAILDGGEVIEATTSHGVSVRSLDDFLAASSRWEVVEVPAADPAAVIAAARAQIGRRYDWAGVLGIAIRRAWQQADAWFCSELVAASFHAAGTPLFRTDAWRVTPRDIYIRTY